MTMSLLGADHFAESNRAHFQDTGCHLAHRFRVRFRPSQHDDAVSFGRETVYMSGGAVSGRSEVASLHRRANRRTDGLLCYAESAQNFGLPVLSRPTVTPHSWNDEWLSADCSHRID